MMPRALKRIVSIFSIDIEAFAICVADLRKALARPSLEIIEAYYGLARRLELTISDQGRIALRPGLAVIVHAGPAQRLAASGSSSATAASQLGKPRGDGFVVYGASYNDRPVKVTCGDIRPEFSGTAEPFAGPTAPMHAVLSVDEIVRSGFREVHTH